MESGRFSKIIDDCLDFRWSLKFAMNRGKVNVVLRVKPLDGGEVSDKVTVVDNEMVNNISSPLHNPNFRAELLSSSRNPTRQKNSFKFVIKILEVSNFDFCLVSILSCFGELDSGANLSSKGLSELSCWTVAVQVCGEEVIKSCLEGYNGTIIAYGQTGSGKTHTMFGEDCFNDDFRLIDLVLGPDGINVQDADFHGIMPRAIEQVFTAIERCLEWKVKMTYVEVYNETFRDLLSNSRKPISVLDSTTRKSRGSTSLKGCTPTLLKSKSHAFNLLLKVLQKTH